MASNHLEFSFSQWCKLVEQGKITLNLLRPSRLNTKLPAYAQVFDAVYYQKTPFPPPGMKVMAHVLPIDRCSFYTHTIKGFSVGVAMEHYRSFKLFIPSTGRVCISDNTIWLPHVSLKLTIPYKDKLLRSNIDDLCTTLQFSVKNNILPPEDTTSRKTLLDLNDIFKNSDPRDPPTKPPTPTGITRVIVQ